MDDIGSHRIGMAMFDVYEAMGAYARSPVGRRVREAIEATGTRAEVDG